MLGQLSREPPLESIPDPWEIPSPTPAMKPILPTWQFRVEPHPLLARAENPELLRLPAPKISPTQVLLQDGLKLRAYDGGQLAIQMRKAIALLDWMERGMQLSPA